MDAKHHPVTNIMADLYIEENKYRFHGEIVLHPNGDFGDAELVTELPECWRTQPELRAVLNKFELALANFALHVARTSTV